MECDFQAGAREINMETATEDWGGSLQGHTA